MKILVIDEWIPLPLDSGKKIRTFNLLAPLAKIHDVFYLCYASNIIHKSYITAMLDMGFKTICVLPSEKYKTITSLVFGFLKNFFSPFPLVVQKHYSHRYQKALNNYVRKERFDVIHCEWTHYGSFLRNIKSIPIFLSSHNIESIPWKRFAEVSLNPIKKIALYSEWAKMKAFESNIIHIFNHISAVSEHDASIFRQKYFANSVEVIPNGIDTLYYNIEPKINTAKMDKIIIFSASMDSFVNQDAAEHFIKDIFPIILKRLPNCKFIIAGRNPPKRFKSFSNNNVIVTGTVPDIRPYLRSAAVSVIPLRIASGSRIKILESLASGIPVVSTSIGAEGLNLTNGNDILISDHDSDFAAKCIELLINERLKMKLINSGRELVRKKYDWSVIYPKIEKAWETTINNYRQQDLC